MSRTLRTLKREDYLDLAQFYADKLSGCNKVSVGSVIVKDNHIISFGANRCIPDTCRILGCYRKAKFGDDSKVHRNPEDCRAVHSEIDALSNLRESAEGATIYVTRYPCEGCMKAIISAGIAEVVYGGTSQVSRFTLQILEDYGVRCIHLPDWKTDLSDR